MHCTYLSLSSDEELLAVCEPSAITVYTIQGLCIHGVISSRGGDPGGRDPVAAWHLPDGALLKQVRNRQPLHACAA